MSKTMKRRICLILTALLAFSAAAGTAAAEAPADTGRVIRIREAVAEGGSDALWELVNPRYAASTLREDGYAEMYIWQPEGPAFPVPYADDFPLVDYYPVMMQETAGTGFTLEQLFVYEVYATASCFEQDMTGSLLVNGPVHIEPYGSFSFRYGSAASVNAAYAVVAAVGTDDNGHEQEFYGVMRQMNILPDSVKGNAEYDTENLRADADYEVEVADGVWWVPARALGGTRYTNREIAGMTGHTPEEKQAEISTLYEAVQLFEISNFTYTGDNTDLWEGTLRWEHHKPGRDAVRTNTGCCASDTSWLNYILSGDYEQVGILSLFVPNDDGHAFNYIFQDGYYYFVDMLCFEDEYLYRAAPETGILSDYGNSDRAAGSVHKVRNPEDFVKYYAENTASQPALFLLYEAETCLPIATRTEKGQETVYVPEDFNGRVIEGINPQRLDLQFVKGPEKKNPWGGLRSAKIEADPKWLGDGTGAEPLTAYKPGDVLTLEDFSAEESAVIDGTAYSICTEPQISTCFESHLYLYSGEDRNLRLPLGRYGEAMKDMDSLVLGEMTAEIVRTVPEAQIVLCTREGDRLTVQEVMNGTYYDARKIVITKNEDGSWPATPEYWYLLITRDGETEYRFSRFRCDVSDEE